MFLRLFTCIGCNTVEIRRKEMSCWKLKQAMEGAYTPWKLANATSQSLSFFSGDPVVKHLPAHHWLCPSPDTSIQRAAAVQPCWRGTSSINYGVRLEDTEIPSGPNMLWFCDAHNYSRWLCCQGEFSSEESAFRGFLHGLHIANLDLILV